MEKRFEIKEIESSIDLNDTETVIIDTETNGIISFNVACKLLNHQDQKIKELEEKLKNGKKYLAQSEENRKSEQEKKNIAWTRVLELKQSQNSKAIEVLEQLRQEFFGNPYNGKHEYVVGEIIDKIDIKITELRGGENE